MTRSALALVYVADPMCSWCYGFAPTIARLQSDFADSLAFRLVMGGLRPYTKDPMRDVDRRFVREHWEHVHETTGQPFDFGFFERPHFVYDTEPAARAVVTARGLSADREIALFDAIQTAFYARNEDVTDASVLTRLAAGVGLDAREFSSHYGSPAMQEATLQDFRVAHGSGLTGFPTLLIGRPGEAHHVLTRGYAPAPPLAEAILRFIAQNETLETPVKK